MLKIRAKVRQFLRTAKKPLVFLSYKTFRALKISEF
jgi:hypothetical protein